MAERKELGKISKLKFGRGGYQDAMIGLSMTFDFGGSCVDHFECATWDTVQPDKVEQAMENSFKFHQLILKLMKQAKISDLMDLKGKPVEVTLDGNCYRSWRILTEVL